MDRKRCPPGQVRIPHTNRCVPRSNTTPLGGPASGLWPSGSSGRSQAPAVGRTCKSALFSACFTGCNAPGNCGWTIITPAGTVVFDGEKMIMGSSGANPQGLATHVLTGVPARNVTFQFQLQEVAAPPSGNKLYSTGVFDAAANSIFAVVLFGDGTVGVAAGPDLNYLGTWTPSSGGVRKVHLTIDALGVPSLFIDGVPIPLTFGVVFPIVFMPDVLGANIQNNDLDGQGSYDNMAVAVGQFPPSTVFCCQVGL